VKLERWENKLYKYIEDNRKKSFKWGKFDCCIFVAGAIKEMTGIDFYKEYKGKYSTEENAYLTLYEVSGYKTIIGLLNNLFDKKELNMMQRGDIVMKGDKALGVCLGVNCAFLSLEGITLEPIESITRCWGV